ncbi:MAG: YggS family pyridoxal phosphate-dependent enzyme [Candidatus Omnitrophica bacterium]|nr:YggS family pyridoxal phosphate-dependent enzyme [Candidatus Omnitrophota bacterium]
MINVLDNINYIREIIFVLSRKFNRDEKSIRLVCVTKEATPFQINQAIEAGVIDFGENRIQEARKKIIEINKMAHWHMIGHLQRSKIKEVLKIFDLIQTIDSVELAEAVEFEAQRQNRIVDILIQVNTSGESSKFGINPKELLGFVLHTVTLKHIKILGLMTIAPFTDNPELSRPYFIQMRKLSQQLKDACPQNARMDILSMGMSLDFEVAVEEGSNMVRIGTLIFKCDTETVKERLKCISRN